MVGWWCKVNGQTVHPRGLLSRLPCVTSAKGRCAGDILAHFGPEVTQDFRSPSFVSCPLQAGSGFLHATGSDKYRHLQNLAAEVPDWGANYGVIIS